MLEAWGRNWPRARNTGILTKHTPTLDADILNEPAAIAIEELVRERFEERGCILPRIGKPPKRAIPFRTADPFAKITANLIAADGSTGEKIEFMCDGQQVVVAGIHPDTGKPYSWPLGNLTDIARDDLPDISEAEAQQLVDDIVELLCRDFGYTRAAERPARKGNGAQPGNPAKDWQQLVDDILAGNELHANTRDLAAKMARAGTDGGAIVNFLRGLMNSSAAPRDQRWQDRYDNLPRQVDTIQAKIEREQAAAAATCADAGGWGPDRHRRRHHRLRHRQAQGQRRLQRRGRHRARRSRTRSRYFGNGCCSTTIPRCSPCSAPSPPTNCPAMRSGSELSRRRRAPRPRC